MIDTKINTARLKNQSSRCTQKYWCPYLAVKPPSVPCRSNDTWIVSRCKARQYKVAQTLQDISNEVHLQVVATRVLSIFANGHHIKLPSTSVHMGDIYRILLGPNSPVVAWIALSLLPAVFPPQNTTSICWLARYLPTWLQRIALMAV